MSRFLLTALAALFFFQANAQQAPQAPGSAGSQSAGTNILTGRLLDAAGKPVEFATVTLLRPDSSAANGALSTESGSFRIEGIRPGYYILRILGIGYVTQYKTDVVITPQEAEKDLGKIIVRSEVTALQGATVTADRPQIEMRPDKKVFNVEKNLTSAGGSAADVLQNVPSLQVDADGNVGLRGKGNVTILIDGKPATLLGGDAASALQGLPAASIQSVEVISNPSAKYDAQGMTGIVNIVTKKDNRVGFNGSASIGAGTRDKYNGSINLNLRKGKWNAFLNSSYRLNKNYQRSTTRRTNPDNDTTYNTYEDGQRKFGGWFTTAGIDYTLNERTSFTLTENFNLMQWGGNGVSDYRISSTPGQLVQRQRRSNDNLGMPKTWSSSLDFKHKFRKEKTEITANATYAQTWVNRDQTYTTSLFDGNEAQVSGPILQDAGGSGGNKSLNAQTDFTMPLLNKHDKLDLGLKTQLFWFNSTNDPTITLPGGSPQTDFSLMNRFNYNQQTHAAYASYSDTRGKWSYSAGLRGEYALYNGTTQQLGDKNYGNEFLNLFPSAFVSYQLQARKSLYGSYTRRTNRPSFFQLMPYIDISNPQDTNMGNPDLKPEFIDNIEVAYSQQLEKGHTFIASAYYQHTDNLIERYRRFYPNGYTFTQPQNLRSGSTYGLELTGRAQLSKVWDANLSFNFFYNQIDGTNVDASLNNNGAGYYTKLNTTIKLPAGFSLQLNGNYESAKVSGQGRMQEVYWLDAAVRKTLLNGKANIVVNVSDIFNGKKYTTVYDYPTYYQTQYRDRETRIGNFTFTYRFGKSAAEAKTPRRGRSNTQTPVGKDRNNLRSDESGESGGY